MTMPPPPPDRMHLQYQPAPPPPPGPQQMGPGGAYGPVQYSPEQPVPGQVPVSATLASGFAQSKPGTITGIQVILYVFLAISAIGNVFSIMSMVELFNPFSLISLAFAVYSAIQSLASGVQIARGKRWAWIWSLVSAIFGLALSLTGFIFGTVMFDSGGDVMLAVAAVLVALYGTLLGLLCSKSARQWILMHRIQRGEVQVPGAAMGGMPGAAPMGGMAPQGPVAPQRPETRPGAVTFAAIVIGIVGAIAVWRSWEIIRDANEFVEWAKENGSSSPGSYSVFESLFGGYSFPQPGHWVIAYAVILVCAVITIPALLKGTAFGRIFGLIWSIAAVGVAGFAMYFVIDTYNTFVAGSGMPLFSGPRPLGWYFLGMIAFMVGTVMILIAMLLPGVKAWTPIKPVTPLVMMVPVGQPQAPQQAGPYGQQPQQGGYQQQPYPPQY